MNSLRIGLSTYQDEQRPAQLCDVAKADGLAGLCDMATMYKVPLSIVQYRCSYTLVYTDTYTLLGAQLVLEILIR